MDERVKTKTDPNQRKVEFDDPLENELADSFPASDPPSLTQPYGAHRFEENQKKSKTSETLAKAPNR
jgi:hypothetical protein